MSFNDKFLNGAVSDSLRALAYEDLLQALITSRRNLMDVHKISSTFLKNNSHMKTIAKNTEHSIYTYVGDSVRRYVETVLTLIIFLSDPLLSNDAVLFRILIHCEIDDLFLKCRSPEILFPELFYSDLTVKQKEYILKQISLSISRCFPNILYDYINDQNYTHAKSLQYNIPKKQRRKLRQYREDQVNLLLPSLQKNCKVNIEDTASETSSITSSISSISTVIGNLFSPKQEKKTMEEDEEDYSSIPESELSYQETLEEEGLEEEGLEEEELENTCKKCKKQLQDGGFKTVYYDIDTNTPYTFEYCSPSCIDNDERYD